MNFFTGYLFGQITGKNARPGDAGGGLLVLFGVGISIMLFAGFIVSMVLPVYSVFAATTLMDQAHFSSEFQYAFLAVALSAIWVLYVLAVFGNRWVFAVAVTVFAIMNIAVFFMMEQCDTCILNDALSRMNASERSNTAILSPVMLIVAMSVARWGVSGLMPHEYRAKITLRLLAPFILVSRSRWLLWPTTAIAAFVAVASCLRFLELRGRIAQIQADTGQTFDNAFGLATSVSTYNEYLAMAFGATALAIGLALLCFMRTNHRSIFLSSRS